MKKNGGLYAKELSGFLGKAGVVRVAEKGREGKRVSMIKTTLEKCSMYNT